MRVLILTSSPQGYAGLAAERLSGQPGVEIVQVVLSRGRSGSAAASGARTFRKLWRIGLLGALNGIRMRRWFNQDVNARLNCPALADTCSRLRLPFAETPRIGDSATARLFRRAKADIGISMGNGFIPRRVFSIPRLGMINIHHELLPEFRGAQSVLWSLHEGLDRTGYSIHRIDDHIDTGPVLFREEISLEIQRTLHQTVVHNCARLQQLSIEGLLRVLRDFGRLDAAARPQHPGRTFTTPTIWQFLRMVRRHRELVRLGRAKV